MALMRALLMYLIKADYQWQFIISNFAADRSCASGGSNCLEALLHVQV